MYACKHHLCRATCVFAYQVCKKDSLEMDDADRQALLTLCQGAVQVRSSWHTHPVALLYSL